jgi:hypothetical protein
MHWPNRLAHMVVFCRWTHFDVEVKRGTVAIIKHAPKSLCWTWAYDEREKTKVMVFNSIDPSESLCLKVMLLNTFKYLGILLKTTPNLDSAVECLATANRRSLFTLNHRYAKLRIMGIKLCCDLFNTLVHSTTSYAYEVWVHSNKIKAIEILY